MLLLFVLLGIAFSFADDFCIKEVENPYPESYLSYAFRKSIERAILESGHSIKCKEGAKKVEPKVEFIRETPIAYTPQQRVSAYNLEVRMALVVDGSKKSFSVLVPYSQPEGGVGDLPRRGAIEDALKIMYVDILDFIRRR